jgi:hypothetical protein
MVLSPIAGARTPFSYTPVVSARTSSSIAGAASFPFEGAGASDT